MRRTIIAAALLLFSASPAWAVASTVIGAGAARDCYMSAKAGASSRTALDTCSGALENDPLTDHDRAATLINRGVIHLHRRDPAPAQADFEAALKLRPNQGEAYLNLGAALLLARKADDGIAALDRALALATSQPHEAYYNRAFGHELRGDIKAAYLDYTKAAELAPEWALPRIELERFTVEPRKTSAP